jgi:hypothetical protein
VQPHTELNCAALRLQHRESPSWHQLSNIVLVCALATCTSLLPPLKSVVANVLTCNKHSPKKVWPLACSSTCYALHRLLMALSSANLALVSDWPSTATENSLVITMPCCRRSRFGCHARNAPAGLHGLWQLWWLAGAWRGLAACVARDASRSAVRHGTRTQTHHVMPSSCFPNARLPSTFRYNTCHCSIVAPPSSY